MVDFQSVVTQLPRNVLLHIQLAQQFSSSAVETDTAMPRLLSLVSTPSCALSAGTEQCLVCSSVFP